MKKLLITGASGFIGGYFVNEALSRGYEVYAAIRKSSSKEYLTDANIKFIELDYNNLSSLTQSMTTHGFEYIIHNAGLTKSKHQDELDKVNADYSYNLAQAAIQGNSHLKKFVYMSSLASIGPADFQEEGIICHDLKPMPVTMYGISKLKGENLLRKIDKLPLVIFRPTAVYGPREKDLLAVFKMLNSGIEVMIGKGDQKLTFIYVEDLVTAVLNSLDVDVAGKSYFMSDGHVYSNSDLNSLIKHNLSKKTIKISLPLPIVKTTAYFSELWGNISGNYPILNRDKINEIKAKNWRCDTNPAFSDLAFTPKYNLESGIKKTVEWYKQNNWL